MIHGGMTVHDGMGHFQFTAWERLLESVRRIGASLAQTDAALKEGKALELVRERIVGSFGVTGMQIRDPSGIRDTGDLNLWLLVNRTLTREENHGIRSSLAKINRRYHARIRLTIVNEQEHGTSESNTPRLRNPPH